MRTTARWQDGEPLTADDVRTMANKYFVDNSRVTLDFREQDVAGRATCNSYQGAWSLESGRLSIGNVAVTMMACPEALINQERRFLDALASADGFRFDDTGALLLTSGGNDVIRARNEL